MLVLGLLMKAFVWLAQAVICLPFIVSAVSKSVQPQAALREIEAGGLPGSRLLLIGVVLFQLACVALILFHVAPALGCGLLALFLVAASFTYHRFWRERGDARLTKLNHFVLNVGLIGAFGLIALTG